jgi:hypothetical protein
MSERFRDALVQIVAVLEMDGVEYYARAERAYNIAKQTLAEEPSNDSKAVMLDLLQRNGFTTDGGSEIEAWTDGSCEPNPGPGGWAAVICQDGDTQEVSGSPQAQMGGYEGGEQVRAGRRWAARRKRVKGKRGKATLWEPISSPTVREGARDPVIAPELAEIEAAPLPTRGRFQSCS